MPLLTPHVPNGLIDLMKDLAKEVLRDKPKNIYEFAVIHFEKLILERDGSLDKGYEDFSAFEAYFDGQQRFAVPSNYGYICQKPIKIQPILQPRKSKSDIMASFQAMESINEEDALASAPEAETINPYAADEKYHNAIYVIQRYFRRYMARKKNLPITKSLSAFTAAIIIQRTMRRLFSNKIKLKKNKDSGPSLPPPPPPLPLNAIKLVQDDMDNVSEAASYTSSSTIQMLADGQEGRENRLASAQSRRQRELEEISDGDGDGDEVVGAADFSSMEFKEPTQDEEPTSSSISSSATAVVADDDEEHSHSVVAATDMDRKSIADENGKAEPIHEEKPISPASTTDDTSTAHNIGILSTKIGSNYHHQNLPTTYNHIEIVKMHRSVPSQINATPLTIIPAGLSVPLNYPQPYSLLGAIPDTMPSATAPSPHLKETQEAFALHRFEEYENENGKNNDASSYFQGDGRIRKFDSDTGESLKMYDVYYQYVTDHEFSDSLNESTMEKDSLEPEELDADSLDSNENVVNHMSDIVRRDGRPQDDGSLYGDKNDDEEMDQYSNENANNVQKFVEIERVPTYLYGIHPERTPVVERRNRSRNSEEVHKVPEGKKYLEAAASGEVNARSPEDKSEEESLESKGSTSEESSATQIENNFELRDILDNFSKVKLQPDEDEKELTNHPESTDTILNDKHSNSPEAESQLWMDSNEKNHPPIEDENTTLNNILKTKEEGRNAMDTLIIQSPSDSQLTIEKPGKESIKLNETNLSKVENDSSNNNSKKDIERQKTKKTNQNSIDFERASIGGTTNIATDPLVHKSIDSGFNGSLKVNDEKEENALSSSVKTDSQKFIDSEREVITKYNEDTNTKLERFYVKQTHDNSASVDISNSDNKDLPIEKAQTQNQHELIPSKHDVKSSSEKLEELQSKIEDSDADSKQIEIADSSKDSVIGADSFEQKEKKSNEALCEAEPNEKGSSSNISKSAVKDISKVPKTPKHDHSLSSETSTDKHLDHDQEIESQLQELQSLNDLSEDITSQSHLEIKNSEDGSNDKISRHDDNNNMEKSLYKNSEEANPSGKFQNCQESQITKDEKLQESRDKGTILKDSMSTENLIASSNLSENEKSTINTSEEISNSSELSRETIQSIVEKEIGASKAELLAKEFKESHSVSNIISSEHCQQISEEKSNNINEEKFKNEKDAKISAIDSDSLKKSTSDNVVRNRSDNNIKPSTGGETLENSDNDKSKEQKEKSTNLDRRESELLSESIAAPIKLHSFEKSKAYIANDNHSLALTEKGSKGNQFNILINDTSLIKEDGQDKSMSLPNIETKEQPPVLEDTALEKVKDNIKGENNEDSTFKEDNVNLVDIDKNKHRSILEEKAAEQVKDNIREANNGSTDGSEEKDEQEFSLDKVSGTQYLKECPGDNLKIEKKLVKPFVDKVLETPVEVPKGPVKTEKSTYNNLVGSSECVEQKEKQFHFNPAQTKSSDQFEDLHSKNTASDNSEDINISTNILAQSSERTELSHSAEGISDNDLPNIKSSDSSVAKKEPKDLIDGKISNAVISESKHLVKDKKPLEEKITLETKASAPSSNIKSEEEPIVIKENEKNTAPDNVKDRSTNVSAQSSESIGLEHLEEGTSDNDLRSIKSSNGSIIIDRFEVEHNALTNEKPSDVVISETKHLVKDKKTSEEEFALETGLTAASSNKIKSEEEPIVINENEKALKESGESSNETEDNAVSENFVQESKNLVKDKKPSEKKFTLDTRATAGSSKNINSEVMPMTVQENEETTAPDNAKNINTSMNALAQSSERIAGLEHLEERVADKNLPSIKSSVSSLTIERSDEDSKILKTGKPSDEIISETKDLDKRPSEEELTLEPRAKATSSNNQESKEESILLKETEKALQEYDNEPEDKTLTDNSVQNVIASNENISDELLKSKKKADHEDSTPLSPSVDNVAYDGSSAETSADFSSIGKDLEFFEDTIKYLKNATEKIGEMEEMFHAKSIPTNDSKNPDVLNHSAVLIQSAFRGYQARKNLKELRNISESKTEADKSRHKRSLDNKNNDSESNEENETNAAIKIQSAYRGYQVRKDLKKTLNKEKSEDQKVGNVPNSPNKDLIIPRSPSGALLATNSTKSQIPVAVIHPTNYLRSMDEEGPSEKASKMTSTNSKSKASFERNESAEISPSKQIKPGPGTSVKTLHKNVKSSPQKTTLASRQQPLEKKLILKNSSSDNLREKPSIPQKRSIEKNGQTFIRDPLDQTVKMDQNEILTNRNGNKSNILKTKTSSAANLLDLSKGSKSVRDQFKRKGKSVSINGRDQNQESFDLESLKKELLSTTFKSPPQSGSKKKSRARIRSGKQRSPLKQYNVTKIPQKSPSKQIGKTTKQPEQAELLLDENTELEKTVNINENSDIQQTNLSKTLTVEDDNNLDSEEKERTNNTKPGTLNKTYTVRSSLNELRTSDDKSEHPSDSFKENMDKLAANIYEKSAVAIQKTFRDFRARKRLNKDSKGSTIGAFNNINLRTDAEIKDNDTETHSEKEPKSSSENQVTNKEDLSTENSVLGKNEDKSVEKLHDPALDKAAIKIQKTYRGYRTRKDFKNFNKKQNNFRNYQETVLKDTNNLGVEPEKFSNKLSDVHKNEESKNHNLEKSAITIQKTFRGHQSRKKLKAQKIGTVGGKNEDGKPKTPTDSSKHRSKQKVEQDAETSGILKNQKSSSENQVASSESTLKHDSVGDTNEDKPVVEKLNDPALHKAATKIQKTYRGYRTRKDFKNFNKKLSNNQEILLKNINNLGDEPEKVSNKHELEQDAELTNEESKNHNLEKSAITIQKTFRGYQSRKQLKSTKIGPVTRKIEDGKPKTPTDSSKQHSKQKLEQDAETSGILEKQKSSSENQVASSESTLKHYSVSDTNEDKPVVEKLNDLALDKAATKIQKTYRGYRTRKDFKNFNKKLSNSQEILMKNINNLGVEPKKVSNKHELEQDAELTNEESKNHNLEKSAITIQKTFRGYQSRKQLKSTKIGPVTRKIEDGKPKTPTDSSKQHSKQKLEQDAKTSGILEKQKSSSENQVASSESTLKHDSVSDINEDKPVVEKLNDPALDKAATKIQKTYRGYRTRKDFKNFNKKLSNSQEILMKNINNLGVEPKKVSNKHELEQDAELTNEESKNHNLEKSAITIQKSFRGYQSRKQLKSTKIGPVVGKNEAGKPKAPTDSSNQHVKPIVEQDKETLGIFEDLQKSFEGYKNLVLNKSATIIQKHFRGYRIRKDMKSKGIRSGIANDTHVIPINIKAPGNEEQNVIKEKLIVVQHEVQNEGIKEEGKEQASGELHISDINESILNKETDLVLAESKLNKGNDSLCRNRLTDPDKSATTIQKNFRGYRTRQYLKKGTLLTDSDSKHTIVSEKARATRNDDQFKKSDNYGREKHGVFDSFDVEEFHDKALQKSATTIQKTFRGYKTRKDLQSKKNVTKSNLAESIIHEPIKDKTLSSCSNLNKSESTRKVEADQNLEKPTDARNPNLDHQSAEDQSKESTNVKPNKSESTHKSEADQNIEKPTDIKSIGQDQLPAEAHSSTIKESLNVNLNKSERKRKREADQSLEKPTDIRIPGQDQLSAEGHWPTSKESSNPPGSSDIVLLEDKHSDSNKRRVVPKSSSAGAVLENAASIIQKAYRGYHVKKNNNLSTKSYSNGTHRETTPKEAMENSDESSTFIGPDTSFDLSDVESVETKSEKTFNYDKMDSSEALTPTNNSEEGLASAFNIDVLSKDHDIDNGYESSPQKLRLKRNLVEPTAPPLDEILSSEETKVVSTSPKLKWFVGDDPIIPSDINSSPPSSSVDSLISTYSKLNDLSSSDACRDNLISNQQLTPSINSAVVSTSSLLFTNNNDTLNKNSGTVSANEEENFKKEKINQIEEISDTPENKDAIASGVVKSNEQLSKPSESRNTEAKSEKNNEDKQDGVKEVATDLCKNCAEGIHEGNICSEDLIKTPGSDETKLESSDQIKHFVLMEEVLDQSQSTGGNTEIPVISSQREQKSSTSDVDSSENTGTISDVNTQACKIESSTEHLKSSNVCPAISLIPPSSEDDNSERDSSIQVEADHIDEGVKHKINGREQSEASNKIEMAAKEGADTNFEKFKEKEDAEITPKKESVNINSVRQTDIKIDEDISSELIKLQEMIDTKEGKETEKPYEVTKTATKSVENLSTDKISQHSSNEILEKDCSSSNIEAPLEDAFKTCPGEEFKIEKSSFEDNFSENKDIEEMFVKNQISTEESKKPAMEDNEESGKTNETTIKNLKNEKMKTMEGKNIILDERSSEAEGPETKITEEIDFHKLMAEETDKLSDQKVDLKTATKESLDNKPENLTLSSHKLKEAPNAGEEDTKSDESTAFDKKINLEAFEKNKEIKKEVHEQDTEKDELDIKQVSKTQESVTENNSSNKNEGGIVKTEASKEDEVQDTGDAIKTKLIEEDEVNLSSEYNENQTIGGKDGGHLQEDLEIAAKLIESSLSDPQAKLLENLHKSKSLSNELFTANDNINIEEKDQPNSQVEAKLEKLIEDHLKPTDNIKNEVDLKDLPTENSSQEVAEEPCVKKSMPPTPYSASSDPDESELESTTTKAESTTTTPAYDETSETDVLDIPPSKPDALDAMAEKLREPEEMVARMRQRRASEHKISIDSATDQQAVFEEPIFEPIKPMEKIQKSSSTEAEDEFVLHKLQRGDTTRESSAQSESVIFGDSTSQSTESEDTFNENLDLHSLHRMNTIAAHRSTFKPPSHLFKSVTIDDTVKYIDPEKSTEESGSSFCMDDSLSEDVRKKMMAYSVSEADSDYYDMGDQTNNAHDDFNISTALDNFPSTDTDTTIISAATKIQAGARGFLTRRRIRRASMGTKASLNEDRNCSFGNEAIGESLDHLAEEEGGRRQFNRQTGVNSLPSALEHSDEMLSPPSEDMQTATVTSSKHSSIKFDGENKNTMATSPDYGVNDWLEKPEDDSSQIVSNLEATVARRLTLQRGDAMRNDSTPDDENGNGKHVDLAKNNPPSMGNVLVHEKTMVESTTTTTTRTTTERRNYSDAAVTNKKEKIKWFALRQNSMPVQIDSEVFRVLPKHMRKRIKSAEGEKPKRIRLPRD